jgi:hypothetical protein
MLLQVVPPRNLSSGRLPGANEANLIAPAGLARPEQGLYMAQPPLLPREPTSLERTDSAYSPVEVAIRQATRAS